MKQEEKGIALLVQEGCRREGTGRATASCAQIPLQVIPTCALHPTPNRPCRGSSRSRVAKPVCHPWKSSSSHSIRQLKRPCGSNSPLRSSSCQHIQPFHTPIATGAAGINSDFQDQWQLWDLGANRCNSLSCPEHMEKQ